MFSSIHFLFVVVLLNNKSQTVQIGTYDPLARKGMPCHRLIVEGYLKGMPWNPERDVVVWLDACPNQ